MIILYHSNDIITKITNEKGETIFTSQIGTKVISTLFLLSEKVDATLVWCNQILENYLNRDGIETIFHHQLVMSSYNISEDIFNSKIGYAEQSIFIKVKKEVNYPTWQMSCDVGGIHANTLKHFKHLNNFKGTFKLFLNYVAKEGVLNGLICSSNPNLLKGKEQISNYNSKEISTSQLFSFVKDNYKRAWLNLLVFQLFIYERRITFFPYVKTLFKSKENKLTTDLTQISITSTKEKIRIEDFTVDVIIPTLGRKKYLKDVLLDLNEQTILPKKVIIVEQNPDKDSVSELDYLKDGWNFEIDHTFTHQLGACNARNIALSKVSSKFTFFADDDIRFDKNLFEKVLNQVNYFGTDSLVLSCIQPNQKLTDMTSMLAGVFASGASFVKTKFVKKCTFKKEHELGYGEDGDFGMQLRNLGAEILYVPKVSMIHLKAPIGGFRFKPVFPWEEEKPKPSPTVMAYHMKHQTKEQLRGYKTLLFIKFYKNQSIKNPLSYLKSMKNRWEISQNWALKLMSYEA